MHKYLDYPVWRLRNVCNKSQKVEKSFHISLPPYIVQHSLSDSLPHGWAPCYLRMPPWSQWWGFLNTTPSVLHSLCFPFRCVLGPLLGISVHHTAQSLPEDTVKFICKVTGDHSSPTSTGTKCHLGLPLHAQRLVCITLSGSEINWNHRFPLKEVSTHTDACMLLVHELDNQLSKCYHSLCGVGLHPQPFPQPLSFTAAAMCSQNDQKTTWTFCTETCQLLCLDMGKQQPEMSGSPW